MQRALNTMNIRKTTQRRTVPEMAKIEDKERILKASGERKTVTHKGNFIKLSDLLAESLQTRRVWYELFKLLKGKNLQPSMLYPARLSFRTEGKIKSFQDKQRLKEFMTIKTALQDMLKEL